jgi:ribosomal protein L14
MSSPSILTALSSRRMASIIKATTKRVIYAAPGILAEVAQAIVVRTSQLSREQITISLDFDEHTLRMGYGSLDAVGDV